MALSDPAPAPALAARTLALHWHDDSRPVYTLDTQCGSLRLATGGGDNNVRIWRVSAAKEAPPGSPRSKGQLSSQETSEEAVSGLVAPQQAAFDVQYLSTIPKHTQAINCVRFSPNGTLLASASDDGTIMIWQKSDTLVREFGVEDDDAVESWTLRTACFANASSEIYDLCWSPNGAYICCGLMDNIIRIFNTTTGCMVKQIAEHNHYVQGVTWDPLGEYICSQSVDRSVHVYKVSYAEDGSISVGPTAFYKSFKGGPLELTRENLATATTLASGSSGPGGPSGHGGPLTPVGASGAVNGSTAASIGSVAGETLLRADFPPAVTLTPTPSNALTGPHTMGVSAVTMSPSPSQTTTMEPPHQTPRHKRSLSNSSTASAHSILRVASPLPAVMPSSPKLDPPKQRQHYLYHGEGLQSFFRRLTFSPDGSLLLATSGMYKLTSSEGGESITNTVYVYTRGGINKPPIVHIPGLKKPAIAVRFSPIKYALWPENDTADVFTLPHRMVFAIATQDSIIVYDTQRLQCLGIATNIHYAVITDLAWAKDGKSIFVSSNDGFLSVVSLTDELLGEPIGDFNTVLPLTARPKESPIVTPQLSATPSTPQVFQPPTVLPMTPKLPKRSILEMLGSTPPSKPATEALSSQDTNTSTKTPKRPHV